MTTSRAEPGVAAGGLEGKPSCEVLTGRPPLNTAFGGKYTRFGRLADGGIQAQHFGPEAR